MRLFAQTYNIHSNITGMLKPYGYYYPIVYKHYKGLTEKELSYRVDLALDVVQELYGLNDTSLTYKLDTDKNKDFGKEEVYYIKNIGYYIGSVILDITQAGDKYNIILIYCEHLTKPRFQTRKTDPYLKPLYKKTQSEVKARRRYLRRRTSARRKRKI